MTTGAIITTSDIIDNKGPGSKIRSTTKRKTKRLISTIKTNKTPGSDLTSGEIIKELPDKAIRMITIMFIRHTRSILLSKHIETA